MPQATTRPGLRRIASHGRESSAALVRLAERLHRRLRAEDRRTQPTQTALTQIAGPCETRFSWWLAIPRLLSQENNQPMAVHSWPRFVKAINVKSDAASFNADHLAASASHFFMKLFLAAPANFFSAALAEHMSCALAPCESLSHFLMKLAFAAPASFFSTAFAWQVVSAACTAAENPAAAMAKESKSRFMVMSLLWVDRLPLCIKLAAMRGFKRWGC